MKMLKNKLLTDTEAALKLGITKELLYAYIRNAPKKHLSHERKLLSIVEGGQNYFEETELEEFDTYLKEPWSNPTDKRPEIPKYIQEYLKTEIGGKCPITGKGYPLDNAHIEDYAVSLNHHHHNLIRIAKDEHTKADNGVIPKELLKQYKNRLIEDLKKKLSLENNAYQQSYYPPLPHQVFIGRNQQLRDLVALMETERMIVIQGIGGIGKTELLLNALRSVQYHNPVLYIDIETVSSLDDLLIILHNGVSQLTGRKLSKSLVDELREITITVIFESLEKLLIPQRDEIEDFLKNLMRKTENVQLIITSQVDLSIFDQQQQIIQLSGIDDAFVIDFLKILLPGNIELSEDESVWIAEFCNGHPLSIKLISSLIKFHGNTEKTINIINGQQKIEDPMRRKQGKSTSLDICLSTVYDCFSAEEKSLLFYINCFVGGLKTPWLKGMLDTPLIEDHVATIKQFFFLETRIDRLNYERIAIPNPIRPFLIHKANNFEAFEKIELDALGSIMMEAMMVDVYYVEGGTSGSPAFGIARLEDELPNILEAFHIAQDKAAIAAGSNKEKEEKYLRVLTGIASGLGKFCFTRAYFEYGLMFAKAGIKANLSLNEIDIAATQYMYLAQIYERQFDHKGLEMTVKEMNEIAKRTGNEAMKINAAWANGRLCLERSQWEDALRFYRLALDLTIDQSKEEDNTDLGSETLNAYMKLIDPGNISLLKSEIGKVYEFSGNLEEAIKYYKESIAIHETINDETNLLSDYHHLGYCLIHTGKMDEGIKYLLKTVDGFNRNGQYEYLANSLSELGRIIVDKPVVLTDESIDEEKISNALESLFYQLEDILQRLILEMDINQAFEAIPNPVMGKLLYLTMFISLTQYRDLLCDYIYEFAEVYPVRKGEPCLFRAILNMAFSVGGVDEWRKQSDNEKILKSLYTTCIYVNGGPDINGQTKVFQWLAFWLNHVGLKNGTTAAEMWEEAWNSFDE
jgi:tetratricopeptide (TPR) repeat protein